MSEFKVGDKVVEIETGDEGILDGKYDDYHTNVAWWVIWYTGNYAGLRLYLAESDMKVIKSSELFTKEQLVFLDERYGLKKDE